MITKIPYIVSAATSDSFQDVVSKYNPTVVYDVRCKSTDTKPTDVTNGSTLMEIDTGKLYLFDGDNKTWVEA